jgi:hypothetical protein
VNLADINPRAIVVQLEAAFELAPHE